MFRIHLKLQDYLIIRSADNFGGHLEVGQTTKSQPFGNSCDRLRLTGGIGLSDISLRIFIVRSRAANSRVFNGPIG
jgi:hypothetical protein